MTLEKRKNGILQLTMTAQDQRIIEKGAKIRGVAVSEYIRTLALETAKRELDQFSEPETVALSADGYEQLQALLDEPLQPNPALANAFQRLADMQTKKAVISKDATE